MSAARPEELLCLSSYIVSAEVKSATVPAIDCSRSYTGCDSVVVPMVIKVKKILGKYNGDPRTVPTKTLNVDDTLEINIPVVNQVPKRISGVTIEVGEGYGDIKISPPTGQPLSDKQVIDTFVGKDFLFAIQMSEKMKRGSSFWARAWRVDNQKWVNDTLRNMATVNGGRSCPKINEPICPSCPSVLVP